MVGIWARRDQGVLPLLCCLATTSLVSNECFEQAKKKEQRASWGEAEKKLRSSARRTQAVIGYMSGLHQPQGMQERLLCSRVGVGKAVAW